METEKGWQQIERKLRDQLRTNYYLVMEIKLKQVRAGQRYYGNIPKRIEIPTEIDLHGMDLAEAQLKVNNFLQYAYSEHEQEVLIIHGKGEGILRENVRRWLAANALVDSFAPAGDDQGGEDGATVVYFKAWQYS